MKIGVAASGRFLCCALLGLFLLFGAGCHRRPPRAAEGLRDDLEDARRSCVSSYASESFERAARSVDEATRERSMWRRGRTRRLVREAREALAEAREEADAQRLAADEAARRNQERADTALERAESSGAGQDAPHALANARERLSESRSIADDPCRLRESERLAGEASGLAADALRLALTARERREEEARLREEIESKRRERLSADDLEEMDRRLAERDQPARDPSDDPADAPDRWTVQPGDTLWHIAASAEVYGDPFLWPLLLEANQGRIGDPDLIFPGQLFKIVRDATPAQAFGARRQARERLWPTPDYLHDGK